MKEKEKSNADRLFINLGYKKSKDLFLNYIEYTKKLNKGIELVISFEANSKTVMVSAYNHYDKANEPNTFTMEELQAINRKVKELRLDR